jgi:diacylglycerol kinase
VERSGWVLACLAALAVAAGAYCRLSVEEWRWLILAVGLVLVAEMFNSAIEQLGDAISAEPHANLRFAKDMAGAAVLAAVVVALLIGATVFGPCLRGLFG